MAVGRFVECGSDDFGIDAALHVGYFFGAFVDKENHNVCFRVILRNGVCDVFEKEGLTCFRGSYDEPALAFSYGREHIYHPCRQCAGTAACEVEFLVGEEGSEVLECHAVADKFQRAAVHAAYAGERIVFVVFARGTDICFHNVAGAQPERFNLLVGDIYIVGRGQIVEVGRAEESVSFRNDFKYAGGFKNAVEIVSLLLLVETVLFVLFAVLLIVLLVGFADYHWLGRAVVLLWRGCALLFFFSLVARHKLAALAAREKFAERSVASGKELSARAFLAGLCFGGVFCLIFRLGCLSAFARDFSCLGFYRYIALGSCLRGFLHSCFRHCFGRCGCRRLFGALFRWTATTLARYHYRSVFGRLA